MPSPKRSTSLRRPIGSAVAAEDARAAYDLAAARGRDPQPGAALLDLASGRIDRAWAEISAAVAAYSASPFRCAPMLRAQVEIGLAAGHVAAATSAYQRLRRISETYPTPGFRAWADQAQGAVFVAAGDASAALAPLQAAAAAYHRMQAPYDAACVELLLARAHRMRGDPGEAETHGDAAEALFGRLGLSLPASAQTHHAPARRAHQPGGRGASPGRWRSLKSRGRRPAVHQRGHRSPAPRQHLPKARRQLTNGGLGLGPRAGLAPIAAD